MTLELTRAGLPPVNEKHLKADVVAFYKDCRERLVDALRVNTEVTDDRDTCRLQIQGLQEALKISQESLEHSLQQIAQVKALTHQNKQLAEVVEAMQHDVRHAARMDATIVAMAERIAVLTGRNAALSGELSEIRAKQKAEDGKNAF